MAMATPAIVATPDLILSESTPFLPEVPVPVDPAPEAVTVPLPLPLGVLPLAVPFVEFPEEIAGRPGTLIVLQVAAIF